MNRKLASFFVFALAGCGGSHTTHEPTPTVPTTASLIHPEERHFADMIQLTHGGQNAEAYFSAAGDELIFQTTRPPFACDQIMRMAADGSGEPTLVSTGKGRTTCAYFLAGDERIVYASTHGKSAACPPSPDHSQGYVWPIYKSYEIYSALPDGTDLRQLTHSPGYDAEATVCAKNGSIIFTSVRDGDLELYRMDADGKNVVRLTNTPGYDGGAFFSADCEQIVWRASRPEGEALADYQRLLKKGLVRPTKLELYVANADGSDPRQVTYFGAAAFAPYFFPSGDRIIFASNFEDPKGREFDIYAINTDGTGLEQITFTPQFDGFPMFSPDGTRLAFASNRNQKKHGDTDVYVTAWKAVEPVIIARPADRIMADIAWLSDDARQGRGIGTDGIVAAATYIEEKLQDAGLSHLMGHPGFYRGGIGGSWVKKEEVRVPVDKTVRSAKVVIDGKAVPATALEPASISAAGRVRGRAVAVGFGIVSKKLGRDDYKGRKVKDRIAVVRRFVPNEPAFEKTEAKRRYSDIKYKAFLARERGASALIVVDVPGKGKKDEAPLPELRASPFGDVGIPVLFLDRKHGAKLFRGRHRVEIELFLDHVVETSHNVIGKIPAGAKKKLPGAVVIGAHYDHLGMGTRGNSLDPDSGKVHNGADDNASGVAALLEVARILAKDHEQLARDVYVVAFTAEEMGAVGSSRFVKSPPAGLSTKDMVAMLNMDMVGRLSKNQVSVLGAKSAKEWASLVEPACDRAGVSCKLGGDGYGPSDHTPFYAAGVPVLHFFTGAHTDYHKPSDDAARINAAGTAQIALIVADIAKGLASREKRLTYAETEAPPPKGDVRSHGAGLGTIPDYAADKKKPGLLLSGVRKGSAADKAGLRRGDRIVRIDDKEIRTIYDYMYVLRDAKPGEKATVHVIRDGKEVEIPVTYGHARRRH